MEEGGTVYLDLDAILTLYAGLFACDEQRASDQLRTREGLEGALSRPRTYAYYEAADLAHGIAETQPFIDGNKRIALISLDTFLRVNGFQLTAPQSSRAPG